MFNTSLNHSHMARSTESLVTAMMKHVCLQTPSSPPSLLCLQMCASGFLRTARQTSPALWSIWREMLEGRLRENTDIIQRGTHGDTGGLDWRDGEGGMERVSPQGKRGSSFETPWWTSRSPMCPRMGGGETAVSEAKCSLPARRYTAQSGNLVCLSVW